ncbi:MAG: FAD-binding protein, partial [Gemmatimonadota bacterium]|nr:FAD-binding protein [Gemmatimonadota bacterium]
AEIEVEPGVVLDHLNAHLRSERLCFPVDPSTGARATLGGMAGNNSAGARSIRYGMMVDNVSALEVVLPDGRRLWLGEGSDASTTVPAELKALRALFAREADEIERRTPRTMRNVAGYNLDRLRPDRENLAQLLVGSEGTLAFFSRLRLKLSPLPLRSVLGVCHFPDLLSALDSVQHLVSLEPSAVELVDDNVLRLAAEKADFRTAMAGFVKGRPGALLLVEFDEVSESAVGALDGKLHELDELMGSLGHPDGVVRAETEAEQAAVWSVRKAGLNIVMSMAGPRKPISFIEDCAVPLEHLAEYASSVQEIFARHGTSGTWYAHASVGCLHVRPALNLKDPSDVPLVRRIAEETHEVVRRFGGTHSGEHGDGILRSEFLESMLGARLAAAHAEVKRTFDPAGLMNPGKIVDPPRMDDRALFRYGPGYEERSFPVVLDWSASGGLLGAVERCNNNGACRRYEPGVMCPSFRVTHDERHSTRGRANALRLALTGQLGADHARDGDGLDSPAMAEAMSLCISCKGCRRECPTGVDMARLKLEWQHRRNGRLGVPFRERVLAGLPRTAPRVARVAPLLNALQRLPGRGIVGLAPQRPLPRWAARPWNDAELSAAGTATPARTSGDPSRADAVLFVDTFTRWFDPDHARSAAALLSAGGHAVVPLTARGGARPLCCGRTYLSAGMLEEARTEALRLLEAARPFVEAGIAVLGLEPSCLYTLRDELPALLPGPEAEKLAAGAMMLEEFLDRAWGQGHGLRFARPEGGTRRAVVHGHCHQKAFGGVDATLAMLGRVPGLQPELVDSGCCGMAGAFGYHSEHYETSVAMAELDLLPAVRAAPEDAVVVADGTSCRAQIFDATGRRAVPAATVLAGALAGT